MRENLIQVKLDSQQEDDLKQLNEKLDNEFIVLEEYQARQKEGLHNNIEVLLVVQNKQITTF